MRDPTQPANQPTESLGATDSLRAGIGGQSRLPGEVTGDQIGPFKLLHVLGEGGFGVVWLAERREPMVQRVAIKIIKPGMDSKAVVARFEQERQALAVMDHPNVARVYDGGITPSGRPYFVMEHVKGEPITAFADRYRLTMKQRLELFIPVCEAVQHAHMKGIIHRDIKPSNILVAPGGEGHTPIVKVIDFGVAKAVSHTLTEKTIFTERGQIIGTPEYMSPEQAEMGATDIDTRTDVYSLGVVLYELLSGTLPFDGKTLRAAGYAEIQRIIREVEAPRPSTKLSTADDQTGAAVAQARQADREKIASELRRELEWIPLKALRKDRTRRYASAESLGADVRRYLDGKPLEAAPESRGYLVRKFIRRNRVQVTAVGAVAAALVAGFGTALWQAREAANQRDVAVQAREAEAEAAKLAESRRVEAERQQAAAEAASEEFRRVSLHAEAAFLRNERRFVSALQSARAAYESRPDWEYGHLIGEIVDGARLDWDLLARVRPAHDLEDGGLVRSPSGRLHAIIVGGSQISSLDADTGRVLASVRREPGWQYSVRSVGGFVAFRNAELKLIDPESLQVRQRLTLPGVNRIFGVDVAPNGTVLCAVIDGDRARFVSTSDGENLGEVLLEGIGDGRRVRGAGWRASFSDDGSRAVLDSGLWSIEWFLWTRGAPAVARIGGTPNLQFGLDGQACTMGAHRRAPIDNHRVVGWYSAVNPGTHVSIREARYGDSGECSDHRVAYSPNISTNASLRSTLQSSVDALGRKHLWLFGDSTISRLTPNYPAINELSLTTAQVNPSVDVSTRFLAVDAASGTALAEQQGVCFVFRRRDVRAEGLNVELGRGGGRVGRLDLASNFHVIATDAHALWTARSEAGDVERFGPLSVSRLDVRTLNRTTIPLAWSPPPGAGAESAVAALALSRDPGRLAVLHWTGTTTFDGGDTTGSSREILLYDVSQLDGGRPLPLLNRIAIPGEVDIRSRRLFELIAGDRLAVLAEGTGQLRVYALETGELKWAVPDSANETVSADGGLVAVFRELSGVSILDAATGAERISIPSVRGVVRMAFTRDGQHLVVGSRGESMVWYRVSDGAVERQLATPAAPLAISPDNSRMLAFIADGRGTRVTNTGAMVLLDANTGRQIRVMNPRAHVLNNAAWMPDGRAFAALTTRWSASLFRSVTPEEAVAALLASRAEPWLPDHAVPSAAPVSPPPPAVTPPPAVAAVPAQPDDVDAGDLTALTRLRGQVVTARGVVVEARLTRAGNGLNLLIGPDKERGLLVWLGGRVYAGVKDKLPADLSELVGTTIRFSGELSDYAGRDPSWTGRLQITIARPADITIMLPDSEPPQQP
jgi:serine/threonine protein kinase